MFDSNTLHPSHLPMRAAADLAHASDCLKEAEARTQSAMRALRDAYGVSLEPQMVRHIGSLAASLADLRDAVLRMDTQETADLAERLRRARAL